MAVSAEQLLDKITEQLILDENGVVTPEIVKANQKTIRDGRLEIGADPGDRINLYQSDVEANEKDLILQTPAGYDPVSSQLEYLAGKISDINSVTVSIMESQVGTYDITMSADGLAADESLNFIFDPDNNNPLNVSQFLPIEKKSTTVDVDRADEYLDTNIYELLPTGDTRQARIIRFFEELNVLLPPTTPEFDINNDNRVDRLEDNTWSGDEQYQQNNSISYAQDSPNQSNVDEEEAYIPRLKGTANTTFSFRTIEDIYNTIKPYLTDILEEPINPSDDRPIYQNQSSGYLKFRNLNQGIIIRNTNQDFITGISPSLQEYLTTGFTITMWVKFLDRTSQGTLFNFGNPTRTESPFGIRLETFVGNVSQGGTRHVRLVVMENDLGSTYPSPSAYRDSHVGMRHNTEGAPPYDNPIYYNKIDTVNTSIINGFPSGVLYPQYTDIPHNYSEWYFICATYNPNILENESITQATMFEGTSTPLLGNSDYWNNNLYVNTGNNNEMVLTSASGWGNKCKVEIISRSDLLRARGFKV